MLTAPYWCCRLVYCVLDNASCVILCLLYRLGIRRHPTPFTLSCIQGHSPSLVYNPYSPLLVYNTIKPISVLPPGVTSSTYRRTVRRIIVVLNSYRRQLFYSISNRPISTIPSISLNSTDLRLLSTGFGDLFSIGPAPAVASDLDFSRQSLSGFHSP